jgi:uncharacterized membrane protein YphA (DoxX/SURF4 family)
MEETGLKRRISEIVVACALLITALIALYDSYGRGMGWGSDGPQSGYFPARIAIILIIASLIILWQGFKTKDEVITNGEQMAMIAKIFFPLLAYVFSVKYIGIYVSSALFMAGFMIWVGKFTWWKALLAGAFNSILTFIVFELWFRVPLPKGFLEKWLGY